MQERIVQYFHRLLALPDAAQKNVQYCGFARSRNWFVKVPRGQCWCGCMGSPVNLVYELAEALFLGNLVNCLFSKCYCAYQRLCGQYAGAFSGHISHESASKIGSTVPRIPITLYLTRRMHNRHTERGSQWFSRAVHILKRASCRPDVYIYELSEG